MSNWEILVEYTRNQLNTNQFFSAAAFVSILTGVIMSLKGIPASVLKRIKKVITYKVVIYQTDDLYYYMTEWLNENHKRKVRNVEALTKFDYESFGSSSHNSHTENKKVNEVPVDDYFFFWSKFRLIKMSYGKEKFENASSLKSAFLKNYTISGIFASKIIRSIINGINDEYIKKLKTPYTYQSEQNYFNRISPVKGKKISDVILKSEIKKKIISDIEGWLNSREDYKSRGIPYKRGHCYYGPPGTGKTTIVKSISNEFGLNVYNINLKKVDDDGLISLIRDIEFGSILLFEDIDSIYNGRKRVSEKGCSFTGFLNALDGIVEIDGILVIITTNHIEKMDPALLRAGRMDLKIEIGYSGKSEITEYLSVFYKENIEGLHDGFLPMVDVQNICMENKNTPEKSIELINSMMVNNKHKKIN